MWVIALMLVVVFMLGVIQIYLEVKILGIKHSRPPWSPPAEIKFDPSITTPVQNLYLLSFIDNPLGGPRCCKKMWYAFRYVNSDGRYGPLGPWTTAPVFAGAKLLPCIPDSHIRESVSRDTFFRMERCDASVTSFPNFEPDSTLYGDIEQNTTPIYGGCGKRCVLPGGKTGPCVSVGNASCSNNRPVIGTIDELDYTVNRGDWYAVIHRQLNQFDPTSEGQPIGFLIGHEADQTGGRYSWADIAFSDNLGRGCIC